MFKTKLFVIGILLVCVVAALATSVIPKSQAEQIALRAVGGGTVVRAQLELHDTPPRWSFDITQGNLQFEVWVQAYNGKVLMVKKG